LLQNKKDAKSIININTTPQTSISFFSSHPKMSDPMHNMNKHISKQILSSTLALSTGFVEFSFTDPRMTPIAFQPF
jgi:hypothetical protein